MNLGLKTIRIIENVFEITIQTGEHMEKLKLYTVTKTSSDETLQIGDIIWLSENKDLNNANKGFLSKHEWEVAGTNDFEVEECRTHHLLVLDGYETVVKNKS